MGLFRLGNKAVHKIKHLGKKHGGKILAIGAVAAGGAAAYADGADDRNAAKERAKAGDKAAEIMNQLNEEEEREAQEKHNKLMAEAKQQPVKKGNIGQPAQDPNILQVARNVPGALKKAEKASKEIESAGVFKKGKKVQEGATSVLSEINKPTKKEIKRVSEEERYLQGLMTDAEAEAYINKKAGSKAVKKAKKAEKQAEKRKKKNNKNK